MAQEKSTATDINRKGRKDKDAKTRMSQYRLR